MRPTCGWAARSDSFYAERERGLIWAREELVTDAIAQLILRIIRREVGRGVAPRPAFDRNDIESALKPGTGVHGAMYSYRDVYLDLDPSYRDRFGRPLVRITMDFHDNELKQNAFLTDKFAEIFHAMGAQQVVKKYRKGPYDITDYQTTHLCGGAVIGTIRGPAPSIAFCKAGMYRTSSSWARAASRKTPATTRRALSRPSRSGRRTRSAPATSRIRGRSCMREQRRSRGAALTAGTALLCAVGIAAAQSPMDQQAFDRIERGRYLTLLADCAACHDDSRSHRPFAGGLGIETPFGIVAAPNITPDRDTGIGAWSDAQFDAALREGRRPDGARLYPAMPGQGTISYVVAKIAGETMPRLPSP